MKFTDTISKLYSTYGIIGRAIVLHLNPDDLGLGGNPASLSNGNSGKEFYKDHIICFQILI